MMKGQTTGIRANALLLVLLMTVYCGFARLLPHVHCGSQTTEVVHSHAHCTNTDTETEPGGSGCEDCLICQTAHTVYASPEMPLPAEISRPVLSDLCCGSVQTPSVVSGRICSLRGPPARI